MCVVEKSGILLYNDERLYYKTSIILIYKSKQKIR